MNKVLMTGRLTKEPIYTQASNGIGFTTIVIAVPRPNTKNEITDFFSCVAWKEKADYVSKYIHKGDLVGITGVLQSRSYEDKNTHQNRVITEIYVEQIDFLNGSRNNNNNNQNGNNGAEKYKQQNEAFGTETPNYEPPF